MKRLLILAMAAFLTAGCFVPRPKRVAIMDFENQTSDPVHENLSTAIPAYLMTWMTNAEMIYLIERQDMNRYLGARYGADMQKLRYERWKDIGRKIDADYLIAGEVSQLENNFVITARLFSVRLGQVVPGSATRVSCARANDIFPRMKEMSSFFIYQVKYRQPGAF